MVNNEQKQTPACDYDIAIVGAGIAGATLAASLKKSGLKVALSIKTAGLCGYFAVGRNF